MAEGKKDLNRIFLAASALQAATETPRSRVLSSDLSLSLYQLGFSVKHDLSRDKAYQNHDKEARSFLLADSKMLTKMERAIQAGERLFELHEQREKAGWVEGFDLRAAACRLEIKEFLDGMKAANRGDIFNMCADPTGNEYKLIMKGLDEVVKPSPSRKADGRRPVPEI
jgi:hypothetical protein